MTPPLALAALPFARRPPLGLLGLTDARLPARRAAGGRPLWYGRGPVDSWLDHHADHDRLRLVAPGGWRLAHAPEAP